MDIATEIKNMLARHNYHLKVVYKDGITTVYIPNREQEPLAHDFTVQYKLDKDGVDISSPGNYEYYIAAPKYAQRCAMMIDILRMCEQINFAPPLIEFYVDDDTIEKSEAEFITAMGKVNKKEKEFFQFITQTKTALMPFHDDFTAEAKRHGFEKGYEVVKKVFFGERR